MEIMLFNDIFLANYIWLYDANKHKLIQNTISKNKLLTLI